MLFMDCTNTMRNAPSLCQTAPVSLTVIKNNGDMIQVFSGQLLPWGAGFIRYVAADSSLSIIGGMKIALLCAGVF
jgi:hypothetical protein